MQSVILHHLAVIYWQITFNGMWPSGKAPGFGPGIRGFESLHPSQDSTKGDSFEFGILE